MADAKPALRDGPRVDTHAHVFDAGMPFADAAHSRPDYAYPVEAWLADMASHGVSHGVIAAASLFDDDNAYTLGVLARHANLRGTVLTDPSIEKARLRTMAEGGVVGVRLVWRRRDSFPDLASDPWRSHLRALADCGLHVELLAAVARLQDLLPALAGSGVRVVVDHFGVPTGTPAEIAKGLDAMLTAGQGGNCWVKLSAGFRLEEQVAQQVTDRLVAELGAERLLWGSDAPFINHEAAVDYGSAIALYRRLVPNAETRSAIDLTAMKLFFEGGKSA
ncbi:amidohydrolase family protein [Novosphingobium aquimarinum]|uniref:amidohydrolase family protein n=1 Tax=Novosphingobium aquimarinum TaxID=2682494 RepID=UPI0018DBE6EE|nr:amidohydrolase family protein [Novosphingobium aquimarinum]